MSKESELNITMHFSIRRGKKIKCPYCKTKVKPIVILYRNDYEYKMMRVAICPNCNNTLREMYAFMDDNGEVHIVMD